MYTFAASSSTFVCTSYVNCSKYLLKNIFIVKNILVNNFIHFPVDENIFTMKVLRIRVAADFNGLISV